jgi:hypothetical protein
MKWPDSVIEALAGPGDPDQPNYERNRTSMTERTVLAHGQDTPTETIIVELLEADQTPAVIIVRWPNKPSVFHPRRFPGAADSAARVFAAAAVRLAAIKRERRL